MRRSGLLIVGIFLATTTGLALLGLWLTVADSSTDRDAAPDGAAVAQAFVAALNNALDVGDAGPLRAITTIDFVEHNPLGAAVGLDGLVADVRSLGATYPDLRFTLVAAFADRNHVVARIAANGSRRTTFLGLPLTPALASWTTIDLLRLEDGKIAERWTNAPLDDRFTPVVEAPRSLALDATDTLALARLTLEPTTDAPTLTMPGAGLLVVDQGRLLVAAGVEWRIIHAATGQVEVVAPDVDVELEAADVALLPAPGARLGVISARALLLAALVVPASATPAAELQPVGAAEWTIAERLAEALVGSPDLETMVVAGIVVEPLARVVVGDLDLPSLSFGLSLGQAVVQPGGGLPHHRVGAAEIIAVEGGAVAVSPGRDKILLAGRGDVVDPPGLPNEAVLGQGDAVVATSGVEMVTRSVGETAATLLVLVVTPR